MNKKTSRNVDLLLALAGLSVRFWDVFGHMYIGYYIRVIFIKREIVLSRRWYWLEARYKLPHL